jgi:DNA repair exonuclease SbcCD ATPase subunit
LSSIKTTMAHLRTRLEDVAVAHQKIITLLPLVDQQHDLENRRDELTREATQYDEIVKEGKRLVQQQTNYLQQQATLQQKIADIEPLQPLAALLQERMAVAGKTRAAAAETGRT